MVKERESANLKRIESYIDKTEIFGTTIRLSKTKIIVFIPLPDLDKGTRSLPFSLRYISQIFE